VASILNFLGSRYDFDTLKGPSTPWIDRFFIKDYSNSKLANVMHARKLGQLLKGTGVTTYSCHPGIVATDVWRNTPRLLQPLAKRVLMIDERVGARTQLYCATAPLEGTGLYYDDCQVAKSHSLADNQEALDELYQKSMEMVQSYLL
jgi:dehydrogenase/reductase SDR family protein 13